VLLIGIPFAAGIIVSIALGYAILGPPGLCGSELRFNVLLPRRILAVHSMKFSIRDLFLTTFVIALGLGWLVDHAQFAVRQAAREKAWEKSFRKALEELPKRDCNTEVYSFESPTGTWRVFFRTKEEIMKASSSP
jgi:hypothetical protein